MCIQIKLASFELHEISMFLSDCPLAGFSVYNDQRANVWKVWSGSVILSVFYQPLRVSQWHSHTVFGSFAADDKCVQECEEGFYADEESQECEACHEDCETCLGPNYDDCNSCDDGTQLLSGECVAESQLCDDNSFLNGAFIYLGLRTWLTTASMPVLARPPPRCLPLVHALPSLACPHAPGEPPYPLLTTLLSLAGDEECEPCHPSCRTCSGPGKNNCDSCEKGILIIIFYS